MREQWPEPGKAARRLLDYDESSDADCEKRALVAAIVGSRSHKARFCRREGWLN